MKNRVILNCQLKAVEFEFYSSCAIDVWGLPTSALRPSGTCYRRVDLSAGRVLFENISGISQTFVNDASHLNMSPMSLGSWDIQVNYCNKLNHFYMFRSNYRSHVIRLFRQADICSLLFSQSSGNPACYLSIFVGLNHLIGQHQRASSTQF
jgi:hypothetical protein